MLTLPLVNVQLNALDALLAGLGARLSALNKQNNPDLQKKIEQKQIILQFLSDDGVARFFEFDDGMFVQHLGKHPEPNLTISFKNSTQGAKLLLKADTAALMQAIQDNDVTVAGDYKLVLWFVGVVRIATRLPDNLKSYVDTAKPYTDKALAIANKFLKK